MSISVVTSITGGKDDLLHDQVKGKAQFIAYLDFPFSSQTWEIRIANDNHEDPRRDSRIHKMLVHKYVDTEYSIWIDGNIRILKPPEDLIAKYLKDHDIAVFKHPTRDCLYQEAIVCAKKGLDEPEILIEQVLDYEKSGYAKNRGLAECGIIFRRHTPKVEAFNNAWWAEFSRYSRRDQVSFMYAADSVGLRVNIVPDFFIEDSENHALKQSGDFDIITHQHSQ